MLSLRRRCVLLLGVAFLLLWSAACSNGERNAERPPPAGLRDPAVDSSDTRAYRLMRLVRRTDTLSTLTRALRQAGMVRDLNQGGPFTLFAPTDRAFQRYLPGFDSLLVDEGVATGGGAPPTPRRAAQAPSSAAAPPNRDSLRTLLQFHLVRGHFTRRDVADSLRLGTLLNESFLLEPSPRQSPRLRLRVRGMPGPIPILRTIEVQNGVLHLLPRPLRIPPPDTSSGGALRPRDTTTTPSPS